MANLLRGSRGTTRTRADEDGVSDARLFLPRGKKFGKQAFGRLHWQYGVRSGLFGVSQAGSRLCVPIPHVLSQAFLLLQLIKKVRPKESLVTFFNPVFGDLIHVTLSFTLTFRNFPELYFLGYQ